MPKNSRFPKISCCQLPRLMQVSIMTILGLSLLYLTACQPAAPTLPGPTFAPPTATQSTPEPPPPTFTPIPPPTETPLPTLAPPTILPTLRPTDTSTPDPLWSILFTGAPCSETASDCLAFSDTPPPQEYFIYSDGTGLQPLSEMGIPYDNIGDTVETIQLSSDLKRVAYMEDDNHGHFRFWIGDVDGSNFTEIYANAQHFYPFSFFGNDPNCLAGFDDQLENDEVVVTLYKSCIGDAEPTLVETAVLPINRTGAQYLLSPQGDKWTAYINSLEDQAVLYVQKIGDSNPPQQIFQQQPASCTHLIHWQDNETIEFLYAICDSSNDRTTYFYVTDWEGKDLTTRYELPALEEPPSASSISTRYYVPEAGDWYSDDNFFIFSPSTNGSPLPKSNGLLVLNLITGEVQQILSNISVSAIRAWLPGITNVEE